jgi:quinol monooxygenase YgiN
MIVVHCNFEATASDRAAFDEWFLRVVSECRTQQGCILYEYLLNPEQPTRGVLFSAWETPEHSAAHITYPAHVEMAALGTFKWGMRDLRVRHWSEDGYAETTYPTTDDSAGDELRALIRAYRDAMPA